MGKKRRRITERKSKADPQKAARDGGQREENGDREMGEQGSLERKRADETQQRSKEGRACSFSLAWLLGRGGGRQANRECLGLLSQEAESIPQIELSLAEGR